jgi:hypothetical protein
MPNHYATIVPTRLASKTSEFSRGNGGPGGGGRHGGAWRPPESVITLIFALRQLWDRGSNMHDIFGDGDEYLDTMILIDSFVAPGRVKTRPST